MKAHGVVIRQPQPLLSAKFRLHVFEESHALGLSKAASSQHVGVRSLRRTVLTERITGKERRPRQQRL